jgi:hypothetical protein
MKSKKMWLLASEIIALLVPMILNWIQDLIQEKIEPET